MSENSKKPTTKQDVVFVIFLLIFIFAIISYFDGCKRDRQTSVNSCVSKGVSFYKKAGIYPEFSTHPNKGRKVEDVVRERCKRNTAAFDH